MLDSLIGPEMKDYLIIGSAALSVIALIVSLIASSKAGAALEYPSNNMLGLNEKVEQMGVKMKDHSGRFNATQLKLARDIQDFKKHLGDLEQQMIDSVTVAGSDEEIEEVKKFFDK